MPSGGGPCIRHVVSTTINFREQKYRAVVVCRRTHVALPRVPVARGRGRKMAQEATPSTEPAFLPNVTECGCGSLSGCDGGSHPPLHDFSRMVVPPNKNGVVSSPGDQHESVPATNIHAYTSLTRVIVLAVFRKLCTTTTYPTVKHPPTKSKQIN